MSTKCIKLFICLALMFSLLSTTIVQAETSPSVTTFTPTEIDSVLTNPYMGWAPWASGGPYSQPHSLVYINVTWRELEPTKGNYAFDAFERENKFSYWSANGKKIILRINMDYPESTSHKDIPDWLYNELSGDGTWYDIDWGKGFSPNYSNPKLIAYHRTLINALAARYNNDKRVPIIALGSLGQWGEFHTKKSSSFTIPFPKVAISDQYVQPYVDYFTNKMLIMRRPFQIAKSNGMGLFNDSFGSSSQTYDYFVDYINNGYTDYLTGEKHPAMPDYWKTAPSGGEIANYPGLTYLQDSTINTSLQMLRDSHTSWLGPCGPGSQPTGTSLQANFDKMLKTMGYRFVLQTVSHQSQAEPGSSLDVSMKWQNKGVAPFYYKWPLELSLSDSNGNIVAKSTTSEDIRTWLPGSKSVAHGLNIPSSLAAGTYNLCVGILDPDTGLPGINLAISGKRPDGRYTLSQINVANTSVAAGIEISGQDSAVIPSSGERTYTYSASVKDQNGNAMTGEKVQWSLETPVSGVSIDASSGTLTVAAGALAGNIRIKAVSENSPSLTASKAVTLAQEASQAGSLEITGATYVEIPKTGVTYSDYKASVKSQYSAAMAGETVTWSLDTPADGITLDSGTGKLVVGTAAKESKIILRATSNSNAAVTATKELTIFAKPGPVVTSLEISGSAYVQIPKNGVTYSDYTATVKDQDSNTMAGETVTWSLDTPAAGVTLDSGTGKLVVDTTAGESRITLRVTSNSKPAVTAAKELVLFAKPDPVVTTLDIKGSTYVEIPKSGVTYSDYMVTIKDQDSNTMAGQTVTWSLDSSASGVTLDSGTGKLVVGTTVQEARIVLRVTSNSAPSVAATKELVLFAKPDPVVTTLDIKGSTYVEIPKSGVTYSDYTATIKDQDSNTMAGETVTWSMSAPVEGVTLNSATGKMVVSPGAKAGTIKLQAVSNSKGSVTAAKDIIFIVK